MDFVDTHCHAGTSWFEPIETLLACMDNNGVQRALLTQHRGMYDNSYLLECIARFPGRFSAIAGVDASDPDAPRDARSARRQPGRLRRPLAAHRPLARRRPRGNLA